MTIADELLKLEELHRRGAINDDEFAKAKAALLRSTSGATNPVPRADAITHTPAPLPPRRPESRTMPHSLDEMALPASVQSIVRGELRGGEKVLWAGQPSPGRFAGQGLLPALFGIPFTGFAIFWIFQGMQMNSWKDEHFPEHGGGMDACFPLFGIPFVLVGLCLLGSPLWLMVKAQNTAYVVTNQRAVLFEGGWSTHVRSFTPGELGQIERRQHGDGSGDIILAREAHYRSGHYSGTPGNGGHYVSGGWSTREVGFFGIPDVKAVESLLLELAATVRPE